ncbi:MAG: hypothetical protein ACFFFT_01965 [Candidatus Thorarchaeota archaeon]
MWGRLSISEAGDEQEDDPPENDPNKDSDEEYNPSEDKDLEEDKSDPNGDDDWEEDKFDPNETYDWDEDKFDPNENYEWDAENRSDDITFDDNSKNDNNYESNYNRDGSETILSPPEQESRDEPIEESEHEPDPELVPEWADKDDLAGNNIPEIDVPEGTFEPREDTQQEPIEEPEREPDPELVPEWADKEDLAGDKFPEIDVPENTFEPREEPDPELVPEWADKEDLAGDNTPEIDVPEGTFEPREDTQQEPIEEPEKEPDPELIPEWANKEDLAGDNTPKIGVPEGTFEPREDTRQEPIEEPEKEPDPELIPEWANKEDLAGDNTPEIGVPEGTFEPREDMQQEPIEEPEREPDPELVPEWADKEDLAGDKIPEIDVPEGTFEPRSEGDQSSINSSDQKQDQDRNNDIISDFSNDSSPKSIQSNNDVLILADNYSSSHNEKKSSGDLSQKKKLQDKRKERESHSNRGMSDKNISNRQKSSQSTVLVLKSETHSHSQEREAKKEIGKKESKKEDKKKKNDEKKETSISTKDQEEELPKIKRESDNDVPDELKERYRNETGRRPYYDGKKTKGFEEWLKNDAKPKKEERVKKKSDQKKEPKEDWQILLERWLKDVNEDEIPREIIKELIKLIQKYQQIEDLEKKLVNLIKKENLSDKEISELREIIKDLNNLNSMEKEIFEDLSTFKNFYNSKITWFEHEIKAEENKFPRYLIKKLSILKEKTSDSKKILNFQTWKALLKKRIESLDELNEKEKEMITQILGNPNLIEQEIEILSAILSKLHTDTLIEILGDSFRKHTKYYVKWGWDFYDYIKKNMLQDFFLLSSKDSKHKKTIRAMLFEYFNQRKREIEEGKYIPIFENIDLLPDFKDLKEGNFRLIRNEWFKENFNKSYKEYISDKRPSYKSLLFDFLSQRLEKIKEGTYIPLYKEIMNIQYFKDLKDAHFYRLRKEWYIENLGRDFKSHIPPIIKKIFDYLDKKKKEIIGGSFFPTYSEIKVLAQFQGLNKKTFRHARSLWYRENFNKTFKEFSLIFDYTIKSKLYSFLSSKKKEIEKGRFVPKLNFIKRIDLFRLLSASTILEIREDWYKENFGVPYSKYHPNFKKLLFDFLSNPSIVKKIKRVKFIPKYKFFKGKSEFYGMSLSTFIQIRRQWFEKEFDITFRKYFRKKTRHKIEFYKFRDRSSFIRPNYKSKRHRTLKLIIQLGRCLLTGKPLKAGHKDFHHLDYNATNDDKNNLGFLEKSIHLSKVHPLNLKRTSEILQKNLKSLIKGKVPKDWKKRGVKLNLYEKKKLRSRKSQDNIIIKKYKEL